MRFSTLFLLFGLLELATLIGLGYLTNAWVALAVVFGTMVLGANLLRVPGLRMGGVLLMVPGLITDVLGLVLLLPWPRRFASRVAQAWFLRGVPTGRFQRVVFTTTQGGGVPPGWGPPPGGMPPPGTMPPPGSMPPPGWMPPQDGGTVQAEVLDVKPSEQPELPPESSDA